MSVDTCGLLSLERIGLPAASMTLTPVMLWYAWWSILHASRTQTLNTVDSKLQRSLTMHSCFIQFGVRPLFAVFFSMSLQAEPSFAVNSYMWILTDDQSLHGHHNACTGCNLI